MRSEYGTIKELELLAMHISTDIKSVTYLKSRAADVLEQINKTNRPVIITQNGEPGAVLQDRQHPSGFGSTLLLMRTGELPKLC
jgi:prevent-host-death family protein